MNSRNFKPASIWREGGVKLILGDSPRGNRCAGFLEMPPHVFRTAWPFMNTVISRHLQGPRHLATLVLEWFLTDLVFGHLQEVDPNSKLHAFPRVFSLPYH
jgi:hypothetical protein